MTKRTAPRDNCDNCDKKRELFFHDATGDSLCQACIDDVQGRDHLPEPTGRKNTSHANCGHASTPKDRAACRKIRALG